MALSIKTTIIINTSWWIKLFIYEKQMQPVACTDEDAAAAVDLVLNVSQQWCWKNSFLMSN